MTVLAQDGGGFNALQSLQAAFSTFLNYIPQVIGALLVLIIGYIIARLLRAGVSRLLVRLKLDDRLTHGSSSEFVARFSPLGRHRPQSGWSCSGCCWCS